MIFLKFGFHVGVAAEGQKRGRNVEENTSRVVHSMVLKLKEVVKSGRVLRNAADQFCWKK